MRYIIIPARLNSYRLDQKVMQSTEKGPVLGRTIKNALPFIDSETKVIVATDSASIMSYVVQTFPQVECYPTQRNHPNGTSRIFEVAKNVCKHYKDVVVNLQGDMAVIDPKAIEACLKPNETIRTAYYLCQDPDKIANPNNVKVVTSRAGYALYFSRSVIPYKPKQAKIHVGVYGYSFSRLSRLMNTKYKLDENSEENLEQLYWLQANNNILVTRVNPCISIDTEDDLKELYEYDINHR